MRERERKRVCVCVTCYDACFAPIIPDYSFVNERVKRIKVFTAIFPLWEDENWRNGREFLCFSLFHAEQCCKNNMDLE